MEDIYENNRFQEEKYLFQFQVFFNVFGGFHQNLVNFQFNLTKLMVSHDLLRSTATKQIAFDQLKFEFVS